MARRASLSIQKEWRGTLPTKILSLYEKNILQSTGNMLHLFGFGFARDKGIQDNKNIKNIEQIGYASGTCLFTSSNVFKKVGLLDPFIFLYHDDLDLGWRAAQLGINSYCVPSSIIYHAESYILKWGSKKFFWLERNRKYCLLTHYSRSTFFKMLPALFLVDVAVFFFYWQKGFLRQKIMASFNILKNYKHIQKRYKEIQHDRIISDKEILKNFSDEIAVPKQVTNKKSSQFFNNFIRALSRLTKKII